MSPVQDPEKWYSHAAYRELLADLEHRAAADMGKYGFSWAEFSTNKAHDRLREIGVILKLGLFDAEFYQSRYLDIRVAGVDPLLHYLVHGDAEGRLPNPAFHPDYYREQVGRRDLGVTALYHYACLGEAAGLSAWAGFNARRYLEYNPKLVPWVDHPLTHYLWLGRPGGLSMHRSERLRFGQEVRVEKWVKAPVVRADGLQRAADVFGPLDRVAGLAVSARGYLDGLVASGFGPVGAEAPLREFGSKAQVEGRPEIPPFIPGAMVRLVHMNGDMIRSVIDKVALTVPGGGGAEQASRYQVGIWYWELPTLPPEWFELTKYFHEFWAPTPFIAGVLRRSTGKPVRVVPPYLPYLKDMARERAAPDHPRFVYCFDAHSTLPRKNPLALLKAFQAAFPGRPDARLTFKISYGDRNIPEVEELYAAREQDGRIEIIDRILPDEDLHALIGSATAYVSPHRSEGLGLTIIEAMSAGVPVVGAPFGGAEPFLTPETGYPVAYSLCELPEDYQPYPKGFVWADPDVENLARAMRQVVDDPHEAARRAAAGRRLVLDTFASPAVVAAYRAELERIAGIVFG